MSQQLISRSPDLKRLRDDGYNIEVKSGFLIMRDVPYVDSQKQVRHGILVSKLDLAGDVTTTPSTHVMNFAGDYPCDRDGRRLDKMKHQSSNKTLLPGLDVNHSFSSKPTHGKYKDFYEKMTTYAALLSSHAQSLDPKVTAKTFPVVEVSEDESVFRYQDTASSRAEICMLTERLAQNRVAIVGLGGTGSYVLDLVAKTPVKEIHLFDMDIFSQHNAFRAPGAPSSEQLRDKPSKVDHFENQYSSMRRGIVAHNVFLDSSNVEQLEDMDFVFLCLDSGDSKREILDGLEDFEIPFIDVGIGVQMVDNALLGILRVTTSNVENLDIIRKEKRIPLTEGVLDPAYSTNIQIADLNSLTAALAVIKWKKTLGFYIDLEKEYHSTYTIDGNALANDAC
jgi:tRNA A37 threonylcarbamoyladenosine dehydratase